MTMGTATKSTNHEPLICTQCGQRAWTLYNIGTDEERMVCWACNPRRTTRPERVLFGAQQTVNGRGVVVATCGRHALVLAQQVRGDGGSWCIEQPQRLPDGTVRLVTGRWLNLIESKAEARIAFGHITGEEDGVLLFDRDAIFRDYDAWRRR